MNNIPVTITDNKEIAPRCFRLVLSGQLNTFHIQPGQFVMLKVGTNYDPLLRRPFAAFCTKAEAGRSLEIYYQVVGRGTQLMTALMPGTALEILGPLGNGFIIPPTLKHAVLVAGGMGIVPIRCLAHTLSQSKSVRITVLYGTQTAANLLFLEEFEALSIALQISTDDGTQGHHGFVTDIASRFLENLADGPHEAACFSCGPWSMLRTIAEITTPSGLPCQVSLETRMACGIGACLGCVVKKHFSQSAHDRPPGYMRVCMEGPVFQAQEIAW